MKSTIVEDVQSSGKGIRGDTMKSTIVEHIPTSYRGTRIAPIERWCMQCGVHVDTDGNIDLDFYTARQYLKFMAVPVEQRCKHQIDVPAQMTNKELLIEIGNVAIVPDLRLLLAAIVRRLP
jgi:hypothetical protein